MQPKFLAILALTIVAANAAISTTDIIDSAFIKAPKAVIDSSLRSDEEFAKSSVDSIFFSPGLDADTLHAWKFNWNFSQDASISIVKRTIDATTLDTKGDDILIKTDIVSKIGIFAKPGIGYIGFPTVKDSGKDTADNLHFSVLATSATEKDSPIEVQLTDNSNVDTGIYIIESLWHNEHFLLLWAEFDKKTETDKAIFLQGISAKDGSLKFDKAIKVTSLSNPLSTTMAMAGLNGADKAKDIIVVWKEVDAQSEFQSGAVMQTNVQIDDGSVAKATLLREDTEDAFYFPSGMVSSADASGALLVREMYSERSEFPTYMIAVFYDGPDQDPKALDFKTPKNYFSPVVKTFNLEKGFVAIAQYSGESDALIEMRSFDSKGEAISSQKKIADTQGALQFFQDAKGALWVAYSDFDTKNGHVEKSYLGKLIA